MLDHNELLRTTTVELVLNSTENDPYVCDGFTYIWVYDNILCIKVNKITVVDWANYVLKSFYETGQLKNQYALHIENSNQFSLIRLKDHESIGMYPAGYLITLCLGYYKTQVQEPIATFNDFLGVC